MSWHSRDWLIMMPRAVSVELKALCLLTHGAVHLLMIQAMGRTPLSEVSPKKTLEGAACGLSASVAVSVVLARLFQWPTSISR